MYIGAFFIIPIWDSLQSNAFNVEERFGYDEPDGTSGLLSLSRGEMGDSHYVVNIATFTPELTFSDVVHR